MECTNIISCPCGSVGINTRICVPDGITDAEMCARLSQCSRCEEGLGVCTECPDGSGGPFCSRDVPLQKRQVRQTTHARMRPSTASQRRQTRDAAHCDNPGPVNHGRVQYLRPDKNRRRRPSPSLDDELEEYPVQSVLEYSCDEGYYLQGPSSLTCQSSGDWSAEAPSCVPDCGRSFMQRRQNILNGTETISGDWPWVVSISVEDGEGSDFICGGAILNTHTIITAAHCLRNNFVSGKQLILRFGKHHFNVYDDDTEVLIRRSHRVIVHPDYSNRTLDSDIGLVIFRPRIRYSIRVQPICLPTRASTARNIQPGKIGYVGGWGETGDAIPPDMMLMATLPVVSNQKCMNAYRQQNLVVTNNMFCAGYDDARQSVCGGDSGSPLVFSNEKSKRYTLEGLVSFGVRGQCGVAGKYAIFTKVFRFKSWIIRNSR